MKMEKTKIEKTGKIATSQNSEQAHQDAGIVHRLTQYGQAAVLRLVWLIAGLLPVDWASRLGAGLFGILGPLSSKRRQVQRNLSFVLPDAPHGQIRRVARGVWRNFGAVLTEYPHVQQIVAERCSVCIPPSVQAIFDAGRAAVFVSGHLANWEILPSYLATKCRGFMVAYSPDDNPFIETSLQRFRHIPGVTFVGKEEALRTMLAAARREVSLGLLPDLRVDTGVMLPLFNVAAPTTISPARIAQRIEYPLVPVHVERLPRGRFKIEFHAPLEPQPGTTGRDAAISVTRQFHTLLEAWIGRHPDQWLCTKRRWPKQASPTDHRADA